MTMLDWIRFGVTAFFLLAALICFASEVLGLFRFDFVMNRMHSAGVGDTFALFCVIMGLAVASGFRFATLKLFLILLFMWFTSPVSTHFLSQVEYYTNKDLGKYVKGPRSLYEAGAGQPAASVPNEAEESGKDTAFPMEGRRPFEADDIGESEEEQEYRLESRKLMEAEKEERRKGAGPSHGIDGNH